MAIKKPRKETKKPPCAAANASGTSVAMAGVPPHGALHVQHPPPPRLPPGVYFSPTREECLGFLNRWIGGEIEMPDARGYIFCANVYGESPDSLRRRHPPASIRGRGEHAWWFLSQTKFQSNASGRGATKRADRSVKTGGFWRLEQSKENLELADADGVKNCFGFYTGTSRRDDKTPWLMQEFTSANDDGAGKQGVPALYRVYVSPRATADQQRDVFGEDGVKKGANGKRRPARAMVSQACFDGIADLLPPGSVRAGVVQDQEHVQAPPSPPPVGLLDYHGQQGQDLGDYQQQQGPYLDYHGQQGQDLGDYQQQQGPYLDYHGQQGQDLGQYHQQQQPGPCLGQYQQQQQPTFSGVTSMESSCASPGHQGPYLGQYHHQQQQQQQEGSVSGVTSLESSCASPGHLGEIASPDNLSMSLDEFMKMLDEQPAETA